MQKGVEVNTLIKQLMEQAGLQPYYDEQENHIKQYTELVVKKILDEVAIRASVCGDRAWCDGIDRQWIELDFDIGPLSVIKQKD